MVAGEVSGIICGERVGAEKTKNVALKGRCREESEEKAAREEPESKKWRRAQCHQGPEGACQERTVVSWNKLEKLHEGEN